MSNFKIQGGQCPPFRRPRLIQNASLENLYRYFLGDRLISLHTDHPCPAYSPYLSPLDYFLWGYLKASVYMLTIAKILMRSRIAFEWRSRELPMKCWA